MRSSCASLAASMERMKNGYERHADEQRHHRVRPPSSGSPPITAQRQ